jgi:hypothetical protein
MQFVTELVASLPRCRCPEHGVKTVIPPWAAKHSRFTLLFELLAIEVIKACRTVEAAAKLLRLSWSFVHTIMARAGERGLDRRDARAIAHRGLPVPRDADGRIIRIRYVLPRHKAANWVGRGRGRKSTRPGAKGVVELTPFEFLDRLVDLVPPPRKHRHRYHGVFAPNHKLRKAVTARAIGNIGKRCDAAAGGHVAGGQPTEGCCDTQAKPRSHDTSRIAWAKLMARVGEEFPLECPACGGDIRLISFITEPGPIRKILTHTLLCTERRTTRTASDLARPRPAHRLGRARAGL